MTRTLAALAAALLLLSGCAGGGDGSPAASPPASVSDPPAPKPAPRADTCHALAFSKAAKPTGGGRKVPCTRAHTAITVHVGTDQQILDGHLLAVDAATVQSQLATECPRQVASYLGADTRRLRLSRFETLWFGPSVAQAQRGARWFRCDVVAVAQANQLVPLPRTLRGVLSDDGGLDAWGTCGTTSPSKPGFAKVICSEHHAWRAIDVVDLTGKVAYLGKAATHRGNAACKSAASARAGDALSYSWSFQWPSREQWTAGERYGLCWVPDGS